VKAIDREKLISIGEVLAYLQSDRYLDKGEAAQYCGVGLRMPPVPSTICGMTSSRPVSIALSRITSWRQERHPAR